jgi:ceramide glucosyltransferase
VIYAAGVIALVAAAYQVVALAACLRHLLARNPQPAVNPSGISILKPVRGLHAGFEEAIRSHATQNYPCFELLLGYRAGDLAAATIARAEAEFPGVVRGVVCSQDAPNGKVGTLMDVAKVARYPILIVNDADITVPPGYLSEVAAPLSDPRLGLVTCLYRAEGQAFPGRWEALGVATEFAPSTLVAPFVGVSEFGLGSTLAFRRADLDRIGGFAAIADYLADDYQLGCKLHALGLKNLISPVVVRTKLHGGTWSEVWRHQVRWARTVRLSRLDGYLGLPVTFATLWAVLLAAAGFEELALGLLALRLAMAFTAGWCVLRAADVLRFFYLIPLRDLYGVAVWVVGLFGDTVEWGDKTLRLDQQGRIR